MKTDFIIGIAGGTGSGKTTLSRALIKDIGNEDGILIQHDAYYKDLSHLAKSERDLQNFDHPDVFDDDLLSDHLHCLHDGRSIDLPIYDYAEHLRKAETISISSRPIVILEGILILADPKLRKWMDLKIFVDAAADLRLIRRLKRDIAERGRTLESVIKQYLTTVRPMHNKFVEPSKQYADLIIRGEGDMRAAINMLVSATHNILKKV